MTEADRAYVEEFAAESANLLRRALANSARKRAEERAKIMATQVPPVASELLFTPRDESWEWKQKMAANGSLAKDANRRKAGYTKRYEFRGEKRTLAELSIQFGIEEDTLRQRTRALGWSLERAVTTPVGRYVRRRPPG